jgi:hypothetical protein
MEALGLTRRFDRVSSQFLDAVRNDVEAAIYKRSTAYWQKGVTLK